MKSVTVLGSGIIGLTTAIILQEAGFQVRIIANEKFGKTVSRKSVTFFVLEEEKKNE